MGGFTGGLGRGCQQNYKVNFGENTLETATVVKNGTRYLTIRALVEKRLNGQVSWDNKTQTVEIKVDGTTVKLPQKGTK